MLSDGKVWKAEDFWMYMIISKADKTNQKKGVRQGALELPRFYKDLFRQENNLIMDEIYRVAVYNSCIE